LGFCRTSGVRLLPDQWRWVFAGPEVQASAPVGGPALTMVIRGSNANTGRDLWASGVGEQGNGSADLASITT
jgi:hypothetical protein